MLNDFNLSLIFTNMLIRTLLLTTLSVILAGECVIDSLDYLGKINKTISDFSIDFPLNDKIYFESCNLVTIGKDIHGRDLKLDSIAAVAFLNMKNDAEKDSIRFRIVSAFRTFEYQASIINRKLNKGRSIRSILKENTLPGYSEHHTGRAIDFISEGSSSLSIDFDKTKTFKWLVDNANQYGFYLSYPKDNKSGVMYEPWHWMYRNE